MIFIRFKYDDKWYVYIFLFLKFKYIFFKNIRFLVSYEMFGWACININVYFKHTIISISKFEYEIKS